MDEEMREHLDRMMTEMNRGFERLIDRMSLTAIQARNAPRRDDQRGHQPNGEEIAPVDR